LYSIFLILVLKAENKKLRNDFDFLLHFLKKSGIIPDSYPAVDVEIFIETFVPNGSSTESGEIGKEIASSFPTGSDGVEKHGSTESNDGENFFEVTGPTGSTKNGDTTEAQLPTEPEDVDGEQVPEVDGSEDEVSSNAVVPRHSAVPRLPPMGDVAVDLPEETKVAGSCESMGPVVETLARGTSSGASVTAGGSGLSIVRTQLYAPRSSRYS